MNRFFIAIIFCLCTTAFCAERETIRDATGKVVGTATTDGNRTVYRDATGKTTGTATKDGNRTIYRDATGKAVGTATESGNRTAYRDATGKTAGFLEDALRSGIEECTHAGQRGELRGTIVTEFHVQVWVRPRFCFCVRLVFEPCTVGRNTVRLASRIA